MKNIKGITLISLVATIMVLAILVSIVTYSGINVIESSKYTAFITELKIMQTQVNSIYQKYIDGSTITIDDKTYNDNEILNIGDETNSEINNKKNEIFQKLNSDSSDGLYLEEKENYKYWSKELIKKIGIEGVEQDLFVNIKRRSIISAEGIKYEGKEYYALNQIPEELYNVEYVNGNSGKPTFDISNEYEGDYKWKITISNVQYETGYIKKWQVKYKTDREIYWSTDDNLSFEVNKPGNYLIKLVNGEIESEQKKLVIEKEYATKSLVFNYDAISNTRSGFSNTVTKWEDLSGNNYDGTIEGSPVWQNQRLVFDGVDDMIDTGLKQSSFGQAITIQTTAKFTDISNYRGLYGYHYGTTREGIYSQSGEARVVFSFYTDLPQGCGVIVESEEILNKETNFTIVMEGKKGIKIYLNGVLYKQSETSGNISPRDDYNFIIGKSYPSENRYFKGTMANFKLYSRALTEEEIKANYELDKVRFNIN